ncbi:MaoC family dehydratase [Sphingomonas sp.]|uniref:MaoC family dehydratase n=1 Tax=Sphingomonas sp. TaxID=28214 RepID=UPI002BE3D02A|nr:MaoC family dehydratase [Sphingomonas sp.]HTG37357.1 MaoC family dehydratase [Sphingomonas sp.]
MRYFEDLTVGEKAAFGHYVVSRDEVVDFARRYDPQPFHLSDEGAAATHFGRLAASGWHSCAMTMAMLVEHMKNDPQAALGAGGVDELRWLKPVYPGDTLRCETELLDKRQSESKPGIGFIRSRMTAYNQHDEPVLSFIANALIRVRGEDKGPRPVGSD